MKIKIVSDLHLEFCPLTLPKDETDVLILAGDIVIASDHYNDEYHNFFSEIQSNYKHIIYVMGNHEYYHGSFDKSIIDLKKLLEPYSDVHLLDNSYIVINDVAFVGSTLWTDMNNGNPMSMLTSQSLMNDYKFIKSKKNSEHRLHPEETVQKYYKNVDYLIKTYDNIVMNRLAKKIVFVTHHAPSEYSIHEKYAGDYHMNGNYVSNLNSFIEQKDIVLWAHGHTHNGFDYLINKTRVVCNPRGYSNRVVRKNENINFNPNLLIEI